MTNPPPSATPSQTPGQKPPKKPMARWKVVVLKALGVLTLTALTAGLLVGGFFYWKFSQGLPDIPRVEEYRPPVLSELYTNDNVLAGEFYSERRKVVPYDHIPKRLVQAFIASEDSSFFDHGGIDYLGTARAVTKTAMKKLGLGGRVEGGSTLTQQTAKAILISAEGFKAATAKTPTRKAREAILARRLEAALTKEQILYLYLNNVYLGHHSYGVQSAAENYYRKDVRDLTLGEMALIAGLPQAPSRYSPFLNPEAAKKRRRYVLRRMLDEGMISQAEHDEAVNEEVRVHPVEDVFHEFAPYFAEQVRRDVVDRYGNPALLTQGLKLFATMDSERQRAAQEAVLEGLLALDKRQGYRGPALQLASAAERDAFIARARKVMGEEKLVEKALYVGVVTELQADGLGATVQVGPHKGHLPLLGMRWARKVNPTVPYGSGMLASVKRTLAVGDVLVLRHVQKKDLTDDRDQWDKKLAALLPDDGSGPPLFRLEQEPEPQSALVSIDPHRQYLVAMVGGYDFDANEYNRAFQACRQPGSAFKPFVYSAAFELLNYTEATILLDSPIVEHDPENGVAWKPANYSESFKGEVTVHSALTNSMNIPAVKTFGAVGVKPMVEWAKKVGFNTPLNQDFSSALGSSCVLPVELANAYSLFTRYGRQKPTYFVRKVEDRFGRVVEDHTSYDDPWASLQDRAAAGYARLFDPGEQVMSPETAFITTDLLRNVVREGTGGPASRLGKPAAGKTGTTNDSFDAWFAGFTRDLVTVAWVGYDLNQHPLNRYETGGRAALPIWLDYMKVALAGRTQHEFWPPEWLQESMVRLRIDNKTGKIASSGSKEVKDMWFKKGTAPQEVTADKGTVQANDFMNVQ